MDSSFKTAAMGSPSSEVSLDNDNIRTGNHKKRIRIWTEDDRAKHRVLEKSRREAFSENLSSLARLLPNLASVKESKLSKHTVVDESLKYHKLQQERLDELQSVVDVLEAEKASLLTELTQWRACLDMPPEQAPTAVLSEPLAAHDSSPHMIAPTQQMRGYSRFDQDSTVIYGGSLTQECGVTSGLPAAPVSSGETIESSGPALDVQYLDSSTMQRTALPFPETSIPNFPPPSQEHPVQGGMHQEALWDTPIWPQQYDREALQALVVNQTHNSLPIDLQPHRY